jgi:RimJ/RimL family protein N-acetyltransferase
MTDKLSIIDVSTSEQIELVESLGDEIWTEHYSPIIGKDQVDYMLEKFQSVQAITNQVNSEYSYYLLNVGKGSIGYFSVQPRKNKLFLSKIYILKHERGNGYFTQVLKFIENLTTQLSLNEIELTVNKYNEDSISIYKSKGFIISKSAVFDIGNGFVMDDYVLTKSI